MLRNKIEGFIRHLQSSSGGNSVRWVKPQGIHLTLKFIGEMPRGNLVHLGDAVGQALEGVEPFDLMVRRTKCFPNRKRPRVLAIGIQDPTTRLERIQSSIEVHTVTAGFPKEARKYTPHLTLGRMRRRAAKADLEVVSALMDEHREIDFGSEHVEGISILRSELSPDGPKYTSLITNKLGTVS